VSSADPAPDVPPEVEAIAALATRLDLRVGVAESLTSGTLAQRLGAGPDAADWFRGGLVAYAAAVKFDLLGVSPGLVVTRECAREMARGAARLLGADAVVATTGVGGPGPEEGQPPGTVYVAAIVRDRETCRRLELAGDPAEVLRQTTDRALQLLLELMRDSADRVSARPRPGTARAGAPAGSPSREASP
jgi:nicotinamide-nucleotide amidase